MRTHLAFSIRRAAIRDGVFIPKFYDPDIEVAAKLAEADFDVPELGELLLPGDQGSRLGNWIRRELYGTGPIPYVRTSDLSHWRVRPDFKKGVAEYVYESLRERQDVHAGDLLMVAHGTYLVGNVAIVTDADAKLVLQDHIFRLRVNPETRIDPLLVLAALSTSFVRRQVRTRQFSADIIDKIGERHLGVRVPIPRDATVAAAVVSGVRDLLSQQTALRGAMVEVSQSDMRMTSARAQSRYGFSVQRTGIKRRIFIPKYYDPQLDADLREAEATTPGGWMSIGELVSRGLLQASTGVEVGKMAYGTGPIPFVRTSDLADWEIRRDIRHSVSQEVFDKFKGNAALAPDDILLVRDGTYLVGSSALVVEPDVPALFCGGIYRLRVTSRENLDPYAMLGFLNYPLVRRQMRARQFTRDVIDTLGTRLREVRVPSLFTSAAAEVGQRVREIVRTKETLKNRIGELIAMVEPPPPPSTRGRPGWSMR